MKDPLLFGIGPSHDAAIARQIQDIIYNLLFAPLIPILKRSTAQAKGKVLKNADADVLRDALRDGRVQYEAGVFSGSFNAAISRVLRGIGAALDKRARVFRIDQAKVPGWIVAEASAYRSAARAAHDLLLTTLHDTETNLADRLAVRHVDASVAIAQLQAGWKDAATALQVNPELSPDALARVRRDYDDTTKLPIQEFVQEEIAKLRQMVRENVDEGYRFDRLIPAISSRYEVSKNKAVFLARQETSILVSKFRQARFEDVGVTDYIWMTSHDGRVRDDHKDLDGQRHSYASPPITNTRTGDRNNPGEDFGCRCIARPVLIDSPARARNTGVATGRHFHYDKGMKRSRSLVSA